MNIGIIGSRRRDAEKDKIALRLALKELLRKLYMFKKITPNDIQIVSGGCPKGGDRFAEELAKEFDFPILIHYPDKSKLPVNPQRKDFAIINYERNQWIARDSDFLIAIVAEDRKGGTENTIKHFLKTYNKSNERLILV